MGLPQHDHREHPAGDGQHQLPGVGGTAAGQDGEREHAGHGGHPVAYRGAGRGGGDQDKCDYVVRELGFDACVNYRKGDLPASLKQACPNGVDVYFENVGGDVLRAVMQLLNQNARIPLCGMISEYNASESTPGPNLRPLLFNRALIKGFIVSDHMARMGDFVKDCSGWVRDGRLKYREDVVVGLEKAPEAFIGLLQGRNFGKLLVRVGEDPTK